MSPEAAELTRKVQAHAADLLGRMGRLQADADGRLEPVVAALQHGTPAEQQDAAAELRELLIRMSETVSLAVDMAQTVSRGYFDLLNGEGTVSDE